MSVWTSTPAIDPFVPLALIPSLVGAVYEWEPRIWDPQAASETIKPVFRSPSGTLPPWLTWVDGVKLTGVPEVPDVPFPVTAIADVSDATCPLGMSSSICVHNVDRANSSSSTAKATNAPST